MSKDHLKAVSGFKEEGSEFNKLFSKSIYNYLKSNDYILKNPQTKKNLSAGIISIEDEKE
ncbi:hypothetical protein [Lacrimispora aerotolerans]|uniref:hypothetical protein n=1 Tax=Lacrimispora aerotolerans TaxID=36832 RepID=UPI000479B177|nr:hypothetical protein [Lacrimispora aerotolerans]